MGLEVALAGLSLVGLLLRWYFKSKADRAKRAPEKEIARLDHDIEQVAQTGDSTERSALLARLRDKADRSTRDERQ